MQAVTTKDFFDRQDDLEHEAFAQVYDEIMGTEGEADELYRANPSRYAQLFDDWIEYNADDNYGN